MLCLMGDSVCYPVQILGWLVTFVWASSLWFVFKDTTWHKDQTGPLSSIYEVAGKAKESVTSRVGGKGDGAKEGEEGKTDASE